jgi:protocatechuate 3,4-dioxygenase beta subunit
MMKRRLGVVVGLAILVIAFLLWRGRDPGSSSTTAPRQVAAKVTTASTPSSIAKRTDPRTQARGSIAGVVRGEETKAPIAGAIVCADIFAYDLPAELTRDPLCTTTDAAGAYLLRNLLAAKYSLDAGAKTFRPATFRPGGDRRKSQLELAAGEAKTGIDFALRGGAVEVTGTVSDISGGPVAHAQVRASGGFWGDGVSSPVGESDERGAFSIWMPPGQVQIAASADGYAPSTESGRAPGTIELLLTPESSLSGTVVDARTGKPIEAARVTVESSQWSWNSTQGERTDAQGTFRVQRLTPGRFIATAVTDTGYGRTEGSTLVGLGQHVDGVIVKVFPASRIVGKVMIAGDKPAVCVEANVSFRDEAKDRSATARSEPDGTLIAEGVLPGTYKPQVWCDGYQPKDTYPPIVVTDKDVTDLTWEVEGGATVRGKVLTRSGTPVEDANISARTTGGDARAKGDWSGDRSQRDGSYELRALRTATYRLSVDTDQGVAPQDGYKVDAAASKIVEKDLILDEGGTIKGTVVDADGKPVPDVSISASAYANNRSGWFGMGDNKSDSTGSFTIDALRPGDYRVTARRSWGDMLKKPGTTHDARQGERTTVRVGQTSTVKLVVESQNGTIKGVVVDPDGKPVADAFISSARESDAAGAQATSMQQTRGWGWGDSDKPVLTATDGSFTVTRLAPGTYTLRAYRKGGGEAIAEHVAIGATARLEIKHTGSIDGVATRDGGVPEEITVNLEDLKTGFDRSETFYQTAGHFVIHDLPAGHFHLTVSAEGGRKKVELDLADAEARTGVTVALEPLLTLTGRVVDLATKKPVAGMRMSAALAQGGGGSSFGWSDDERDNISDDAGRFTIKRAPRGQLAITGFNRDFQDAEYEWIRVLRNVDGTGTVDLGDITVIKKRLKKGEVAGDLGLHFVDLPNDTPPDKYRLEVSFILPGGAAAKTEIKVGDVITAIDGVDVTGGGSMNAWPLLRAPVGTKLTLGLARGATIVLVLSTPS